MILETVTQFAEEILRPAARDADDAAAYPAELITRAAELGVTAIKVPEDFDGIAENRTAVTNALVAEALAYGDMGLPCPSWPRRGRLRASPTGEAPISRPPICPSSPESPSRRPVWRSPSRTRCSIRPHSRPPRCAPERLPPRRRQVPGAGRRRGRIIRRRSPTNGKPALFIVESDTAGCSVKGRPQHGNSGCGAGPGGVVQGVGPAVGPTGRG